LHFVCGASRREIIELGARILNDCDHGMCVLGVAAILGMDTSGYEPPPF